MPEEFHFVRLGNNQSSHKISNGESAIGRDLFAFVCCPSPYVSRRHLVVLKKLHSPVIHIKDLKTANGTYINNKRMIPNTFYRIEENDIITLGVAEDIPEPEHLYQFKLIKKFVEEPKETNVIIDLDDEIDEMAVNDVIPKHASNINNSATNKNAVTSRNGEINMKSVSTRSIVSEPLITLNSASVTKSSSKIAPDIASAEKILNLDASSEIVPKNHSNLKTIVDTNIVKTSMANEIVTTPLGTNICVNIPLETNSHIKIVSEKNTNTIINFKVPFDSSSKIIAPKETNVSIERPSDTDTSLETTFESDASNRTVSTTNSYLKIPSDICNNKKNSDIKTGSKPASSPDANMDTANHESDELFHEMEQMFMSQSSEMECSHLENESPKTLGRDILKESKIPVASVDRKFDVGSSTNGRLKRRVSDSSFKGVKLQKRKSAKLESSKEKGHSSSGKLAESRKEHESKNNSEKLVIARTEEKLTQVKEKSAGKRKSKDDTNNETSNSKVKRYSGEVSNKNLNKDVSFDTKTSIDRRTEYADRKSKNDSDLVPKISPQTRQRSLNNKSVVCSTPKKERSLRSSDRTTVASERTPLPTSSKQGDSPPKEKSVSSEKEPSTTNIDSKIKYNINIRPSTKHTRSAVLIEPQRLLSKIRTTAKKDKLDMNTKTKISGDKNMRKNKPDVKNTKKNIPDDKNIRKNIPDDKNIKKNIPGDKNTRKDIPVTANSRRMSSSSSLQNTTKPSDELPSSSTLRMITRALSLSARHSSCNSTPQPSTSTPNLVKIPRKEPVDESGDKIAVRRRSVMDDVYNSPVTSPELPRRKSVSFILDSDTNKNHIRRPSLNGLKSILKPFKEVNPLNVPIWLRDFLDTLLRWNPVWITEYNIIRNNNTDPSLPPIFRDGKSTYPMMPYVFKDLHQYIDTYTNLVTSEVWETILNSMIQNKVSTSKGIDMKIADAPVIPINSSKIAKIECSYVHSNDSKKPLTHGSLVLIKFPSLGKLEYFGLLDDFSTKPKFGNQLTNVSFFIKFSSQLQSKIIIGCKVIVKFIVSLRNELALIKAIRALQASPLKCLITSPKESKFKNFTSTVPLRWPHNLNNSQAKAVMQCMCGISSSVPNIQLIHGPPGTGKSRVIAALVLEYFQRNIKNKLNRGKVLICSQANVAVDEIVKRLLDAKKEHKIPKLFDLVRIGRHEVMQPWAQEVSSTNLAQKFENNPEMQTQANILKGYLEKFQSKMNEDGPQGAYYKLQYNTYKKKLDELYFTYGDNTRKEETEVIKNADVIACTLQGSAANRMHLLANKFAFCVVDEAAKSLEPEVLIPLILGVRCLILVGDNQQLPGFTLSQYARQKGFNESLFSRLLHSMISWSKSFLLPLDVQYRMSPSIAHFPNVAFYEGRLKNSVNYPPLPPLVPEYRVVHIPGNDCAQGESGANFFEARVVARLAAAIKLACASQNMSISVITPYSAHKEALQTQLKMLARADIEVSTVDSFQGQERDVVLISLARNVGTGFLTDPGRMSVLLTRARRSCIVCCNPEFVKGQPLWESFLKDAEMRKMQRKLPKNICKGRFCNTPQELEALLRYLL